MHGGLCNCCRCDKAENRRNRLIDATVDALPDAISGALDDFLSDAIGAAIDEAGGDEDDLESEDFTTAALEALIQDAAKRYRAALAAGGYAPAKIASALAKITQAEAAR